MAICFSTEIKIEIKIYNNPCMESIIQKINIFEKLKLNFFAFVKNLGNEFPSNLYLKKTNLENW